MSKFYTFQDFSSWNPKSVFRRYQEHIENIKALHRPCTCEIFQPVLGIAIGMMSSFQCVAASIIAAYHEVIASAELSLSEARKALEKMSDLANEMTEVLCAMNARKS